MITQPQHQPTASYQAVGAGKIRKNGSSISGGAINFSASPARILERQDDDLLKKDPMMFLPALASKDRNVILTGMYIYKYNWPDKLSDEQKNKLANSLRQLLSNPDTAIRVETFNLLGQRRLLTVDDVVKGLSDEAGDVRYLAAMQFSTFLDNAPVYTPDGKFYKGNAQLANEMIAAKRKLAPVFLKHLNETHPYTRSDVAYGFSSMFKRKVYSGTGTSHRLPDFFPGRIDWKRASWHKREETKKIWTKWWTERGEEALKFAHPPQNE